MENPSNIVPDQLIVLEGDAGLVPKAEPADAGKVLGVLNASGDVGWVVDQSGTFTQQQSNWSETDSSKVTYIENKPDLSVYAQASSLSTVAFSGNYADLNSKPDIPIIGTRTVQD